jgi:hypothetical protein
MGGNIKHGNYIKENMICRVCGKKFIRHKNPKCKNNYCSMDCFRKLQKKDFCKNGHDLKITRIYYTKGNTGCSKCRDLATKKWRLKNKEHYKLRKRAWRLKSEYGLLFDPTINATCEICGVKSDYLTVDHNHSTGEIRGILCKKCNTGIGLFCENIESIKNAIKYLKKRNKKC